MSDTKKVDDHEKKDPLGLNQVMVDRRKFFKIGGAAAAGLTVGGLSAAGYQIGESNKAYIGNQYRTGKEQFFDRKPFEVDVSPGFKPVDKVERPHWNLFMHERTFLIVPLLMSGKWNPGMGVNAIPGPVGDYYRERPKAYATLLKILDAVPKQEAEFAKKKNLRYAIADAYCKSHLATMYPGMDFPFGLVLAPKSPVDAPENTPEQWDFRNIWRKKPLEFKSPRHATELIKEVTHKFGATLVGICKFEPAFMFTNYMRGVADNQPMGFKQRGRDVWGTEVPKHWKSLIMFGAPMHWDTMLSSTGYSTSFDGYSRMFNISALLERFIQELGYASRPQMPPVNYEIIMPPYGALAGLGEVGRIGILITPELGTNVRLAGMMTNIDFEYDKPIDFGVNKFCRKCKICADHCPQGAISKSDEPDIVVRGFKKWYADGDKCFLQWASAPTYAPVGCRVCMGICPYTRKNTWIHTISREIDARDPTGLTNSALLAMQKGFFHYPDAQDFKSDWDGGKEATYHNPPKWLRAEEYFNIDKDWEYYGNS